MKRKFKQWSSTIPLISIKCISHFQLIEHKKRPQHVMFEIQVLACTRQTKFDFYRTSSLSNSSVVRTRIPFQCDTLCCLWANNVWLWFMVSNATFNNISVISWRSVLSMEETRIPRGNYWHVASYWHSSSHNVVLSTPRHEQDLNSQL